MKLKENSTAHTFIGHCVRCFIAILFSTRVNLLITLGHSGDNFKKENCTSAVRYEKANQYFGYHSLPNKIPINTHFRGYPYHLCNI